MSKQEDNRVLARAGARELTIEEVDYVSAAMQAQGNDTEARKSLDLFHKFPANLPSIFSGPK